MNGHASMVIQYAKFKAWVLPLERGKGIGNSEVVHPITFTNRQGRAGEGRIVGGGPGTEHDLADKHQQTQQRQFRQVFTLANEFKARAYSRTMGAIKSCARSTLTVNISGFENSPRTCSQIQQ